MSVPSWALSDPTSDATIHVVPASLEARAAREKSPATSGRTAPVQMPGTAPSVAGAQVQLSGCQILANPGLGVAVVDAGQATLEDCQLSGNGEPALLLHRGGVARLSRCQVVDGPSLGIACHQDSNLSLGQTLLRGNALGGILLGPGAGQPELAEDNTLEDTVLR